MTKIKVLKPFTFSASPGNTTEPAIERKFTVGDHEIADDIANHPWIKAGADGHIAETKAAAARSNAVLKGNRQ